jgi:LuxR family maltose regulon positive regulatory protein
LKKYIGDILAAVSPEAAVRVVVSPSTLSQPPLIEPLSDREVEVLRLIDQGLSNPEIAAKLVLSIGTVKVHTHNIFSKLGVTSRTQAVNKARALGLLA